jgi:hypothetical protein
VLQRGASTVAHRSTILPLANRHALERDLPSARAVRRAPDVAAHDLVAFGDHVLDRDLEIRKAGMMGRIIAFAIGRFSGGTVVVKEVGSQRLVGDVDVFLVHEYLRAALRALSSAICSPLRLLDMSCKSDCSVDVAMCSVPRPKSLSCATRPGIEQTRQAASLRPA